MLNISLLFYVVECEVRSIESLHKLAAATRGRRSVTLPLPVEGQLDGHLDVAVRAHLLRLDELLAIAGVGEAGQVQVLHQSGGTHRKNTSVH